MSDAETSRGRFERVAAGLREIVAEFDTLAHDAWHHADAERSAQFREFVALLGPAVAAADAAVTVAAENEAMHGMLRSILSTLKDGSDNDGAAVVSDLLDDEVDYNLDRVGDDGSLPADAEAAVAVAAKLRQFLRLSTAGVDGPTLFDDDTFTLTDDNVKDFCDWAHSRIVRHDLPLEVFYDNKGVVEITRVLWGTPVLAVSPGETARYTEGVEPWFTMV